MRNLASADGPFSGIVEFPGDSHPDIYPKTTYLTFFLDFVCWSKVEKSIMFKADII